MDQLKRDELHLKSLYLGLALNVILPLLLLGVGYFLRQEAFQGESQMDAQIVFLVLMGVSLADLGVIYLAKRSYLARAEKPESGPLTSYRRALMLSALVYGLAYFLLGGKFNGFLLFISITFVAFLFFKPKPEELDRILGRESSYDSIR